MANQNPYHYKYDSDGDVVELTPEQARVQLNEGNEVFYGIAPPPPEDEGDENEEDDS